MKKRIWINSPIVYILLALVIGMAVQSYFSAANRSSTVLIFQVICVLVALAAVIVSDQYFSRYVRNTILSAGKVLSTAQRETLSRYPLPVAVVGEHDDLVWCNGLFASSVSTNETFLGSNISEYLSGYSVRDIPESGLDVEIGEKLYTVYRNRVVYENEYQYILYFIDNTYFKRTVEKYQRTRPAGALVVFDNLEEISKMAKPGEMSQVSADVEMKIENWVKEVGGYVSRMGTGRYQIVWESQHLDRAIERKFDLLDEVRAIRLENKVNVTLSVGVGRGGKNLRECFEMAGQSLDMALGRGGDQAVIKNGTEYQFFGGVSKGLEKRSKVRARVVANALSTLLEGADRVFVMGHRNSDLDSVGAAVGVSYIARTCFNREAYIVIDKNSTVATPLLRCFEAEEQDDLFIAPKDALEMVTPQSVLVVVDTHSDSMLESREVYDACKQVAVIDHHRKMVNYISRAVIFYHEPFASSASEMVTELIDYISNAPLDHLEADALLSGIMLDTKNFVLKTGVRTFEAAAFLRKNGADPVEAKRLFASSFDSYKQKYDFISNAQIHRGMALAVGTEAGKDFRVVAAQAADELLNISGVDASFVMFPFGNGVNISARSFGRINVQLIMEKIGGGGHLTMAGAQMAGITPEEARKRVEEAIDAFLADRGIQPEIDGLQPEYGPAKLG